GFFLFFVALLAGRQSLASCRWLFSQPATGGQAKVLAVIDWDDTVIDTRQLLVKSVIPEAIDRLLRVLPSEDHDPFLQFLEHLKRNGTRSFPKSYSVDSWRDPGWGFPLDRLPSPEVIHGNKKKFSHSLEAFWWLMREVFDENLVNGQGASAI